MMAAPEKETYSDFSRSSAASAKDLGRISAETTMAFSGETGFTEGLMALAILGYVNPLVTTNTTTFIGASFSSPPPLSVSHLPFLASSTRFWMDTPDGVGGGVGPRASYYRSLAFFSTAFWANLKIQRNRITSNRIEVTSAVGKLLKRSLITAPDSVEKMMAMILAAKSAR